MKQRAIRIIVNLMFAGSGYTIVALCGAPTWADVMTAWITYCIGVTQDFILAIKSQQK